MMAPISASDLDLTTAHYQLQQHPATLMTAQPPGSVDNVGDNKQQPQRRRTSYNYSGDKPQHSDCNLGSSFSSRFDNQ